MTSERVEQIREALERGDRIPIPRGTCRVCRVRVPLRQDGTVGRHMHWLYECGGTGHLPDEDPRSELEVEHG